MLPTHRATARATRTEPPRRHTITAGAGILLTAVLLAAAPVVPAQNALRDEAVDTALIASDAFLAGHPDMLYRKWAEQAYRQGSFERALRFYKRSARFADKVSQGRVAEMYWAGEGVPADRALAYAWMDLAGERGYRRILAIRERYWAELSPEERERAVEVGQAIYDEYGDEVAKPRLERAMFKARRNVTGSRTGFVGTLDVTSYNRGQATAGGGLSGGTTFRGDRFYDETYWEPRLYWAWQAKLFDEVPKGTVEIGELQTDPLHDIDLPAPPED